ncbi:SDR family oxidoreductase [Microbacterium sp. NPDC055357]
MQSIAGRTAVVTGAGSGIGEGIARRLLDAGAIVYAVGRRLASLQAIDDAAFAEGRLRPRSLDVTDSAAVRALAVELAESVPVSILVCAAGTNITRRRFAELTDQSFAEVLDTNVTGTFTMVSAFLDQLRATSGDVVFISSIAAAWPDHSGAAYGASKSALLGLARGLSRDEHANGVRVCTLLPGLVDTPLLAKRPSPPPQAVRDWAIKPEDIAEAVHLAVSLPPRTSIAEMSIVATRLQAFTDTQKSTPELPQELIAEEEVSA